jgi:uncharacterized damage-inducible protein DinB
MLHPLQYPIGKASYQAGSTSEQRAAFINEIAAAPERLRQAVSGLNDDQLNVPYREGGWSIRQITHHIPDSHVNAYTRFKFALTENKPVIKPYAEERWATLADTAHTPLETSLVLLEALHKRWVTLLRALTESDLQRVYVHPDNGDTTLDQAIQLYVWHGNHHIAQITGFRKQQGW